MPYYFGYVKECILAKPIANIINLSLAQKKFSELFKQAHVSILLQKPSLPKYDQNYHPVSKLNYIYNLMEKVIARQIKSM